MRPSTALRVVICLVPGCAYAPGSFHAPLQPIEFRGERTTVGCLDVAVFGRTAPDARGQVVEVTFANRCNRATVIDFPALRATGRDTAGNERSLAIFDPAGELRPLTLEARTVGHEVFELQPTTPAAEGGTDSITGACLDIGALARSPDGERWVCVAAARTASLDGAP